MIESTTMPKNIIPIRCNIHGDFKPTYIQVGAGFSLRYVHSETCPKCASDRISEENQIHMQGVRSKLVCERHNKKCVNAGISPRFIGNDINNFPVTTNNQFIAVNAVNCFLFNFPDVSNMLMIGSVGTGKTLLASCIVESLVDNHNCEIVKLMDMIRKLKGSWSKSSEFEESDIIDHYSNLDLLVIDEIGVQRGTDTEKMFIFDVIDNRYQQRRPTILISNLTRESVSAVIGERCMDRLKQDGGFEIAFDWGSLRC